MSWFSQYQRLIQGVAQGLAHCNLFTCWQSLRDQAPQLWARAGLYLRLLELDWEEEKRRLLRLWGFSLLAACFVVATLLIVGVLILAVSWHSPLFAPVCVLLIGGYALAALRCAQVVHQLSHQGKDAFAATLQELAVDIANLRRAP